MTLTSVYDALPESKPKKQNCGGSSSGNSKSLESSQPAPPPPPPKLPPKECVLCAGIEGEMLDTDMPGKFAHKICALFINGKRGGREEKGQRCKLTKIIFPSL